MEVGIRKGAWRRAWRYPAYLWSLRWVYAVKKTVYTPQYTTGWFLHRWMQSWRSSRSCVLSGHSRTTAHWVCHAHCMSVCPFVYPSMQARRRNAPLIRFLILVPSVLWRCWLGGRKGIRPVKNWVVGCWHGYLSGARCRLAYCPADATATHCLLLQ